MTDLQLAVCSEMVFTELPLIEREGHVAALAAAAPERFGQSESTITAKKHLMVRPSAPRFLNFGDRFELPVVLERVVGQAAAAGHDLRARLGRDLERDQGQVGVVRRLVGER